MDNTQIERSIGEDQSPRQEVLEDLRLQGLARGKVRDIFTGTVVRCSHKMTFTLQPGEEVRVDALGAELLVRQLRVRCNLKDWEHRNHETYWIEGKMAASINRLAAIHRQNMPK